MSEDNWEKIEYKSGEYFGELKNGLPDGEGIYKTSDEIKKGDFRKGELVEGTSERITEHSEFTSKELREGEFKKGQLDGIGKETSYHKDGTTTVCEGYFRSGFLNGEGKIIEGNRVEEGNFKGGRLKGEGRVTLENGNIFSGDIDINEFAGNCKGVLTLPNGEYIQGIFWNYRFQIIQGDKYNSNHRIIESYYNGSPSLKRKLFNKFVDGLTRR